MKEEKKANGKKPGSPRKNASQINMQKNWNNHNPEQEDISDLIRNRMKSLDLSLGDYCKFFILPPSLIFPFLHIKGISI